MGGQGLTMVIVAEASHFETEECIAAREEWANSSDLELVFVDSLQVVTHWSGDNWDGGIGSGLVSNWGGELRDSVCDCLDAFRKSHALFNLPTPNTSEKETLLIVFVGVLVALHSEFSGEVLVLI